MALACSLTLLSYSVLSLVNASQAGACAGSFTLGSTRSLWIPSSSSRTEMAGRQSFSSSRMDRHTGNRVLGFYKILAEVKHTSSGRVDVGVEERRDEPHLGRSGGEVILEDDLSPVQNMNLLPHHEIHGAVSVPDGSGNKSEGMILAPGLPFLGETSYRDAGHNVLV